MHESINVKRTIRTRRTAGLAATGILALCGLALLQSGAANAASVLSGPIDLGTSSTYGVLGGSQVTNTGPTVVNGDLGVDPGSSITGFTGLPNGTSSGAVNDNNAAALQAQSDVTTAFNAAAGLTPKTTGLRELNGLSLSPGVYAGGALSLSNNGSLTLAGDSTAIWVFQAASSLTIGSATHILITGGATACNVFWEVGSSASIGTSAQFQGTILAKQSITAATGATIQGRLLANHAAVTLQANTITAPVGCAPGSTPRTTNGPLVTTRSLGKGTVGTPFTATTPAGGITTPTYTLASGTLPAGLSMNSVTGVIAGTPRVSGTATFAVRISNGVAADVTSTFSIVTAPLVLAFTGSDPTVPLEVGFGAVTLGIAFAFAGVIRRRARA